MSAERIPHRLTLDSIERSRANLVPFRGPHKPETIERMRESHKGKRNLPQETLEKFRAQMIELRNTHPGVLLYNSSPRPLEQKKKIRYAIKSLWQTEEYRQKVSKSLRGNKNFSGKHHSEETKKKMRESARRVRQSEGDKRKRRESRLLRESQRPNVEKNIWNYAKRNSLLNKIVKQGVLTHKEMGALRKHFAGKINASSELIDRFTIAVANLS